MAPAWPGSFPQSEYASDGIQRLSDEILPEELSSSGEFGLEDDAGVPAYPLD